MTLDDWLACFDDIWTLPLELSAFSDRKLHLLTAAFLRRVWDRLPSYHSRSAVEATEKFADGAVSAAVLAWTRSQAARESGETIWLAPESFDDYELINPCPCCSPCDPRAIRYECRVAKQGGTLDGVWTGICDPASVAAGAAYRALQLENPGTAWNDAQTQRWEWQSLFATVREVLGESEPDANWRRWRTSDVLALAHGIYAERAFDRLPILADALQDAGCDDESVLWHCRRPGGHAHGCWVVDLALGFA
ncbi:hypothetical protein [Gemmata palustris]|uniref:hypothetical protein n=1 Tax=Gemmata palustris TaxID=2822762 RepID=UPI001FE3C9C2|nr:hypothetical protein [Gemmata palustris]